MHKIHTLAAIAALGLAVSAPALADPVAAMTKAGCMACHNKDKKVIGPAYKDVGAKYKSQADAVALLSKKVRDGGKGVWGPIPMAPNPAAKISDADLKAAVEWILAL